MRSSSSSVVEARVPVDPQPGHGPAGMTATRPGGIRRLATIGRLAARAIATQGRGYPDLAAYLSDVEEYLHYRSIDVSSVKELAKRWFPKECAGAPQKNSAHRALGDIEESVAELRYYREAVFKRAD